MIENQIKSYFENEKDIVAAYLFGSYASGKVRSCGDIDLAILFDSRDRAAINRRLDNYLIDLSRILRKDIHPVILNSVSEALVRQIFLKGKCILVNDSHELSKFKMIMIARIADFGHYRNMIQPAFISKVLEG